MGRTIDGSLAAADDVPAHAPRCRECGCWDYGACFDEELGTCWWVELDLCSHCALAGAARGELGGV